MNTNTTFNTTSEHKIGNTLYTVTTVFNPTSMESKKLLGESGQEPEKQAL